MRAIDQAEIVAEAEATGTTTTTQLKAGDIVSREGNEQQHRVSRAEVRSVVPSSVPGWWKVRTGRDTVVEHLARMNDRWTVHES